MSNQYEKEIQMKHEQLGKLIKSFALKYVWDPKKAEEVKGKGDYYPTVPSKYLEELASANNWKGGGPYKDEYGCFQHWNEKVMGSEAQTLAAGFHLDQLNGWGEKIKPVAYWDKKIISQSDDQYVEVHHKVVLWGTDQLEVNKGKG